mmetsp:Transcript_89617/g.148994  ORF Transcript_89617/g.148994 Transcript_89617/m.148994 type:complete len:430 (+) Transcript_89617:23-1312(+)|eukprot:CAMPEP_0174313108 /NCGR_PEP_ID=MMETSP0810-20121108/4751_1 /TAXON_ID=73025 ORGANISM="Eutreptiella gymnastica-like, Strain CCMP1594" /NCGR_SAMPLE_ID=MMETSP0810 /ASSEMBLY_ACC=CAM_ASM_000659 /LENGTH=429 /DNA_ID=CAMNT_0015421753 /DNA_START=21 /DNA_END=1310 /DNA_ORIENTATION=-
MAPKKANDIFKILKNGDPDELSDYLNNDKGKVHERNKKKQTALHLASENGDVGCVEVLLAHGADPNACDAEGKTPLQLAVQSGYDDIVPHLLRGGANPFNCDAEGMSSLHWAARMGYAEIAQCLLGEVPLEDDILEEEEDGKPKKSKVVPVDKVSLVKAEDKEGNTALHLAASEPDNMNLALHFLKILSEEGANKCTDVINVKNKDGFNALHLACSTGVSKVLSKMVELGASLSERTKSEETPLHISIVGGDSQLVECILGMQSKLGDEWGAFLNARDKDGNTALHGCCRSGSNKIVHLMLQHAKALDLTLKNHAGHTAVVVAHMAKNPKIVDQLVSHGASKEDIEAMEEAAKEKAEAAKAKEGEEPRGDFSGVGKAGKVKAKTKAEKEAEKAETEKAAAATSSTMILILLFAFVLFMISLFYLLFVRK